jgi:hypothetical protein
MICLIEIKSKIEFGVRKVRKMNWCMVWEVSGKEWVIIIIKYKYDS